MKNKIEFEIGCTVYGQRVVLVKEIDDTYTIVKHAGDQRDQTDTIGGLKRDTIMNMLVAIDKKLK